VIVSGDMFLHWDRFTSLNRPLRQLVTCIKSSSLMLQFDRCSTSTSRHRLSAVHSVSSVLEHRNFFNVFCEFCAMMRKWLSSKETPSSVSKGGKSGIIWSSTKCTVAESRIIKCFQRNVLFNERNPQLPTGTRMKTNFKMFQLRLLSE
jgi:hypothetical protein